MAPIQFARLPKRLSYWGNDEFGICVTAESAYAKACHDPEIFLADEVVIDWARRHGVLNGADLSEVNQMLQSEGFKQDGHEYREGPGSYVDWKTPSTLQAAIVQGPVKIGIDANALPAGAGSVQGWWTVKQGNYRNEDHAVSLSGFGPASYCFEQLGLPVPAGLDPNQPGYLLFTWSTVGFVTDAWLRGACFEAWVRNPTDVILPPDPVPDPGPDPVPDPDPCPCPISAGVLRMNDGSEYDLVQRTRQLDELQQRFAELHASGMNWGAIVAAIIALLEALQPLIPPPSSSSSPGSCPTK